MKRDWELIKKILIALEEKESSGETVQPNMIQGYGKEDVSYQIMLLGQADLITAVKSEYVEGGGEYYYGQNLTWNGHEFLDKAKSNKLWNKVMEVTKEKGIELSYEAIKLIMTNFLQQSFT